MKIFEKSLKVTKDLAGTVEPPNKHFTFIFDKTKLIAFGWNCSRTNPLSKKYDYNFFNTHSELAAILRLRNRGYDYSRLRLINTRINSLGQIGYSRPCPKCQSWLMAFNFKQIYYTDWNGNFVEL